MALPAVIGYCKITGLFLEATADTTDADDYPQGNPLVGLTVTLSAAVGVVRTSAPPATTIPREIPCKTDASGYLYVPMAATPAEDPNVDVDGNAIKRGAYIMASADPDIEPHNWTWFFKASRADLAPITGSFIAEPDAEIDLATVVQVPASPGVETAAWIQAVTDTQAACDAAITAQGLAESARDDLLAATSPTPVAGKIPLYGTGGTVPAGDGVAAGDAVNLGQMGAAIDGLSSTYVTPSRVALRDLFLGAANASVGRSSLDLGVMGTPPTIATGSATLDATLTRSYAVTTTPAAFRTSGGTPTIFSTNFWTFPVVHLNSGSGNLGGNASANGAAAEFIADADKVEIMLLKGASTRGVMVEVDGQRVSAASIAWTLPGSTMYILLTFASRAVRRIRVEFDQYAGFRGVNVPPTCGVWRPESPDITVAVVGDSITAQTAATLPNGCFAHSAGKMLGWTDVRAVGLNGTGYIAAGAYACTFGDPVRVADVVACSPDMVMIPGSTNDGASTPAAIGAAALAAWQAYRAALPGVPIVVGGIFPGAGGPSATVLAMEAGIKAAFDTWADPHSYWVPVTTETAGSWVSGTGKVGATNASGNSDIYVSADGVHPSQAGHDYYARRWATALKERVLPNL